MAANLRELVTDWGGFKELVKELNSTGDVAVERNVRLTDRNGMPRDIDVVVRHREDAEDGTPIRIKLEPLFSLVPWRS